MWVIQLFRAEPKLGPIYQPITHMVALAWPLWLVVPAAGIDYFRQRYSGRFPLGLEALGLGAIFSLLFVLIQWPWSSFMVLSRWSRNWFFNADNFVYWASPSYVERTHHFAASDASFLPAAIVVVILASLSSFAGLAWGSWMERVRR
jgi:hypothetical protein